MASVHLLDVQMEAAALSDTGSNSSVNTGICDQARYCLSAVYGKVTEAPVFRSGRCYFYLSLTDSGLTGHLNNNDKIPKHSSISVPRVPPRTLAVLREITGTEHRRYVPLASRSLCGIPSSCPPRRALGAGSVSAGAGRPC